MKKVSNYCHGNINLLRSLHLYWTLEGPNHCGSFTSTKLDYRQDGFKCDVTNLRQTGFHLLPAKQLHQTLTFTPKLHHQHRFPGSVWGWVFALRLFHCFIVLQIWHAGASVCSVLVIPWWGLTTGSLPSCRSGPSPAAALMMVNDSKDLPLSHWQLCALNAMWVWNKQTFRWTDGTQLIITWDRGDKLEQRPKLVQSQITNMQILQESIRY